MACFHNLCHTLEDIFTAAPQTEDELNYTSATLVLAGLLQLHARTPLYASYRARLRSFPHRSSSVQSAISNSSSGSQDLSYYPSPTELASAGFFHTGPGDETVCPACGLGLRDWQSSDQPEACHIAYSTAIASVSKSPDDEVASRQPTMPCLYLAVHRLLTSELPLARKHLVPVGSTQTVCSLPGITTQPTSTYKIVGRFQERDSVNYPSLADRLQAIANIMAAPPAPQGWPVENARSLGHSDDLIVLALWYMQAETTGLGLVCPSESSLHIDPHGTTDLLRAILRVQEGFDSIFDGFNQDHYSADHNQPSDSSGGSENELTAEDAETAALSRCRCRRIRSVAAVAEANNAASSPFVMDSIDAPVRRIRLPRLYQFLCWWSSKWSVETAVIDSVSCRKK